MLLMLSLSWERVSNYRMFIHPCRLCVKAIIPAAWAVDFGHAGLVICSDKCEVNSNCKCDIFYRSFSFQTPTDLIGLVRVDDHWHSSLALFLRHGSCAKQETQRWNRIQRFTVILGCATWKSIYWPQISKSSPQYYSFIFLWHGR